MRERRGLANRVGLDAVKFVKGFAAAFGLSRFIQAFVFGVGVRDPVVFAAVPAVLLAVALLAVIVPAIRASRLDPVVALRDQ